MGFAAPFVLVARSLLQGVCRRDSKWDEPLSEEESRVWQEWLDNTPNLSGITVPRWLMLDDAVDIQLHIFCDASEKVYATVAYIRVLSGKGDITCRFLAGKARVSPTKVLSISRGWN